MTPRLKWQFWLLPRVLEIDPLRVGRLWLVHEYNNNTNWDKKLNKRLVWNEKMKEKTRLWFLVSSQFIHSQLRNWFCESDTWNAHLMDILRKLESCWRKWLAVAWEFGIVAVNYYRKMKSFCRIPYRINNKNECFVISWDWACCSTNSFWESPSIYHVVFVNLTCICSITYSH